MYTQLSEQSVYVQEDERLVMVYDNQVRLLALPVLKFAGGHVQFVQHTPERCGLTPHIH